MKQLSGKKVEVTLPVVKLRVEDLSYLQGILNREGKFACCNIPDGVKARLKILGLIESVEIPADPKAVKEWEKKRDAELIRIREIVNSEPPEYDAIRNLQTYSITSGKPASKFETRVTEAARKLIKNGVAQVQVKASCK